MANSSPFQACPEHAEGERTKVRVNVSTVHPTCGGGSPPKADVPHVACRRGAERAAIQGTAYIIPSRFIQATPRAIVSSGV